VIRHILVDDCVGADPAMIADYNFSDDLGAGAEQYVISDPGRAPLPAPVSDSDMVIDRAMLSDNDRRMQYDPAKMVNTKPGADRAFRRDRNPRGDFRQSFDQETERLGRYAMPVEPVEEAIDEDRLKSLGQKPPDNRSRGELPGTQSFEIVSYIPEHGGITDG